MRLQAFFKIRGDTDITLIRKENTLDEVNIFHDENSKVLLSTLRSFATAEDGRLSASADRLRTLDYK